MEIIDLLLVIFLLWVAYDFIKEEGLASGLISIVILATLVAVVVLVPYYFGATGKHVVFVVFGTVLAVILMRKILKKNSVSE